MSASAQERMAARLFLEAVFPTMQVLLDDDPKLHKSFENFHATVQFGARDDGDLLCCHLVFDGPHVDVIQGPAEKPDLTLTFSSIEKMNALLRGGLALPGIRGNLLLLPKILSLLMGLMIMSPKNVPKTPEKQALKVKCSLYMITRALSKYNKLGDPDMQEFCRRQPDRIYQSPSPTTATPTPSPATCASRPATPSPATASTSAARRSSTSASRASKGR